MKRLIYIIVAVMLSVVVFAGCGDNDNTLMDDITNGLGTTPSTPTGGDPIIGGSITEGTMPPAVTSSDIFSTSDTSISSAPTEPTLPTNESDDVNEDNGTDSANEQGGGSDSLESDADKGTDKASAGAKR